MDSEASSETWAAVDERLVGGGFWSVYVNLRRADALVLTKNCQVGALFGVGALADGAAFGSGVHVNHERGRQAPSVLLPLKHWRFTARSDAERGLEKLVASLDERPARESD